jgi:hypothetical protein
MEMVIHVMKDGDRCYLSGRIGYASMTRKDGMRAEVGKELLYKSNSDETLSDESFDKITPNKH